MHHPHGASRGIPSAVHTAPSAVWLLAGLQRGLETGGLTPSKSEQLAAVPLECVAVMGLHNCWNGGLTCMPPYLFKQGLNLVMRVPGGCGGDQAVSQE